MNKHSFSPVKGALQGEIDVPGDKSISHRAIMLGSIAEGRTNVSNFLNGEDCLRTIEIFRQLGVDIELSGTDVTIESDGFKNFVEPKLPLYFGNSGTTARLMFGILPALPFYNAMYGDPHLTLRPMDRVVHPLREMGAKIDGRGNGLYLPLSTSGRQLSGIHYELPVKSAQVKSAVLLAGTFASGKTTIVEQVKTRDHTENMLQAFGADIKVDGNTVTVTSKQQLRGIDVFVPGDISSASFFMVAAAIVPGSKVLFKNVGLNKTRSGIIDVLRAMGAKLEIVNERTVSGELLGDVTIQHSELKATVISGDLIPRLIDEIPVIALLATQAEGRTVIKDAAELRVKETDRIDAVVDNLTILGADIEGQADGMIITGKTALNGGEILSYSDHRIAMMGIIASLITDGDVILDDTSSIAISYPTFFEDLESISK